MKKIAFFSALLIVIIIAMVFFAGIASREKEDSSDISSALSVIAQKSPMAKYGIVNNAILFCADDFEKNLNLSRVDSITVTSVPAVTEGSLCLGDTVVNVGQRVSRSNLDLLNFRSESKSINVGAFRFKVNDSEYEMTCNLYLLKSKNSSPITDIEDKKTFSASTHQSTLLYGKIDAYDPDGDEIRFEVVSYPKNGILELDASSGEYTYMPSGSYFGEDSFVYVALDCYGNYSGTQKIELNVEKKSSDITYVDMEDHPSYNAALTLAEKNIMSGETIGNNVYFMPDKNVSRIDFLVMLMNALGIKEAEGIKDTGFYDDAEIPASMKGYVRKARDIGVITGEVDKEGNLCFCPNEAITRAEAAVMINSVVKGELPVVKPVFADKDKIPSWASDAVYSLNHLGILTDKNGSISALSEITRVECAEALYKLILTVNQ